MRKQAAAAPAFIFVKRILAMEWHPRYLRRKSILLPEIHPGLIIDELQCLPEFGKPFPDLVRSGISIPEKPIPSAISAVYPDRLLVKSLRRIVVGSLVEIIQIMGDLPQQQTTLEFVRFQPLIVL